MRKRFPSRVLNGLLLARVVVAILCGLGADTKQQSNRHGSELRGCIIH